MIRITLALLAPLLLTGALQANFSLPHVLSDGMVLQRDKPVRIWGKGEEGDGGEGREEKKGQEDHGDGAEERRKAES